MTDVNSRLERLLGILERDGIEVLSAEEIAVIRQFVQIERAHPGAMKAVAEAEHKHPGAVSVTVKFVSAAMATGFLANSIFGVMRWLLLAGAAWVAFKAGFAEWLTELVNGGAR